MGTLKWKVQNSASLEIPPPPRRGLFLTKVSHQSSPPLFFFLLRRSFPLLLPSLGLYFRQSFVPDAGSLSPEQKKESKLGESLSFFERDSGANEEGGSFLGPWGEREEGGQTFHLLFFFSPSLLILFVQVDHPSPSTTPPPPSSCSFIRISFKLMSRVGRGMMGKFRNGLFLFRLELLGACVRGCEPEGI